MIRTRAKQQFNIIVSRDEDGFFVATVPALPGCHTQARTLSELERRIKEAITLCLSVAKTNPHYGRKIKQQSSLSSFVGIQTVAV